ncbi:MAG TPA: flagellar biosynthetic protein FliR [Egibacteraceae bacterium]|nr:flagellar biosynthetic protein FliR [Egibacteraceae bacterium]
MEQLSVALDPAWAAGLVLSITRVAAFAVASPMLARVVPLPGRLATILAVGLFLSAPMEGPLTLAALLGAGAVNAAVGATLGYLTGVLFHMFAVAGGVVDVVSGLSVAQVIDPTRGEQGAVFSRLFNLTGLAVFFVAGGLELLVRGLSMSVEVVALDGALAGSSALLDVAARQTSRLMLVGAELALPVVSALFIVEVVLGLASRFAPQANVFLLGLPAKLLIALSMVSVALLLFPEAMDGLLRATAGTFTDGLRALRG